MRSSVDTGRTAVEPTSLSESSPLENGAAPSPATAENGHAARRRGALTFVVIFLVATVALLVLARYSVNTSFINWYLFQVARSTSWVLSFVGESSSLEDPQMFEGREVDIRAALAGALPKKDANPVEWQEDSQPPLTAYEAWRYRSLLLKQQYEQTRQGIETTKPREGTIPQEEASRIAALRDDVNRLTRSTHQDSPAGRMQVLPQQMGDFLHATEDALRKLENGELPASVSRSALLKELETKVAEALAQQQEFLRARAAQLSMQVYDRHGPTVSYVAKAGLSAQLRIAEAELARARPSTANGRVEKLKAEVEALKTMRAAATSPAELAILDRDVRFRFNVVPDCGALPSMAIFFAAVIAFPARMWKRLVGLLAGLPMLYLINVARLACLAVIGAYWGNGKEFEFAHEYVWQAVYILFVVMIWLLWVELLVRPGGLWRKKTV